MELYIGNGPYCYANATSMLLGSVGDDIAPALVEVLCGVGLGAFWLEAPQLLFLGGLSTSPDVGISRALSLLGYEIEESALTDDAPMPEAELRAQLEGSPAILGPVDMGELSYTPDAGRVLGADHFIVALGADDDGIYVHDPAGYPHAFLSRDALDRAWKAVRIPYRRGSYRWWRNPRRISKPDEGELFTSALESFAQSYRESEAIGSGAGIEQGSEALRTCARALRKEPPSEECAAHLQRFALALGARRALDYAAFFAARRDDPRRDDLAAHKEKQARILGLCHTRAVAEDWSGVAASLEELAPVEDAFRNALMR